jgi:hypothetical protein
MNKVLSALAMAFAGAAAASVVAAWRKNHLEEKALHKEALSRWEDDGGPVPTRPAATPTH